MYFIVYIIYYTYIDMLCLFFVYEGRARGRIN